MKYKKYTSYARGAACRLKFPERFGKDLPNG